MHMQDQFWFMYNLTLCQLVIRLNVTKLIISQIMAIIITTSIRAAADHPYLYKSDLHIYRHNWDTFLGAKQICTLTLIVRAAHYAQTFFRWQFKNLWFLLVLKSWHEYLVFKGPNSLLVLFLIALMSITADALSILSLYKIWNCHLCYIKSFILKLAKSNKSKHQMVILCNQNNYKISYILYTFL